MTRQSYSRRRIELRAKDVRANRQAEGADERAETEEERRNIEAFFASRGIDLSDENRWKKELRNPEEDHFRSITVTVKNIKLKDIKSIPFVRKEQPSPEAKSLKAAYLREIAMAARRRGLIMDGHHPEINGYAADTEAPERKMPTTNWVDSWDDF